MLRRTNGFQTKELLECIQLLDSAVPILNDLAKSFKDSCDPELDLAMLNHVFIDSVKRVYQNNQAQSNSQ